MLSLYPYVKTSAIHCLYMFIWRYIIIYGFTDVNKYVLYYLKYTIFTLI